MRIYLGSTGIAPERSANRDFERLAERSRARRHHLVDNPDDADVVLFTECHQFGDPITLARVQRSDDFRQYRGKCYVFDQRPRSYCSLPGLFTSVPSWALRPAFQVPWSYHMIARPQDVLGTERPSGPPDLLFSYVGSMRSHRCRRPIFELRHRRGVIEWAEGHVPWDTRQFEHEARRRHFADVTLRSSFVLCPRGRATSSFRFYETMAAGSVPVVISDDWVPPLGVDISEFAIRWPEGNLAGLVDYLERMEPCAAEMGARAKQVFDERFAPEVIFDAMGDALESLASTNPWDCFPQWGYLPDRRVGRHLLGRVRKRVHRAFPAARQYV